MTIFVVELLDVVRMRRSCRRFLSREVPDEVLAEMLEAGRLAPSAGGAQSFFFGVVRDPSTKQDLAKAAGQDWVAGAPVVIAHCARLSPDPAALPADDHGAQVNRLRFGQSLLDHLAAHPDRRAAAILRDNGVPAIPGQQLFLAAVNRGLSACWIGQLDVRRASEILRLPEDMACLYLMPVGYPAQPPPERSVRPIEECVFYDSWDTRPSVGG